VDRAEPGDQLGILLRGLGPKDVRRGIVLLPDGHKHPITDKAIGQIYVLKPDEGGAKMPLGNYFTEHMFSLTWDTIVMIKVIGKDFIMPGELGEIEIYLGPTMYMEPQQKFTLRCDGKTVATGMFTQLLPKQTSEEKDKRIRKKWMKAEMERLGFCPYNEKQEKRCKPDYSNSPKNEKLAEIFAKAHKEHAADVQISGKKGRRIKQS